MRQSRGANSACAEGVDVCELLLAELQSRRARLQKLLHLVKMEAERDQARRAPVRSRASCENAGITRTA
jgi:hypothetical protein